MKGIRIRPEQDGLRSSLFNLEAEIMEIVWEKGWDEFAVLEVLEVLEQHREIAYTTVMTTISRLYEKELLTRRKNGRRYLYCATMTRPEFIEAMTKKVLGSLPPMGREAAMAFLVDRVAEADEDELDRLEALIRKRRKGGVYE